MRWMREGGDGGGRVRRGLGAEDCACGEWTMQRACSAQCGWSSLASSTTMTGSAADLRMAMRSACPPEGGSSCRQPRRKAASHVTRKPTRELHRLQTVDASSSRCARTTDAACTSRQVQSRPSPITAGLSSCAAAASSGVSVRGSMTVSIGRPLARPPDTPGITNLLQQARKGLAREEARAQPVFAHKEHCAAQQNQRTRPRDGIAEGNRDQCGDHEVAAPDRREPARVPAKRRCHCRVTDPGNPFDQRRLAWRQGAAEENGQPSEHQERSGAP